MAELAAVSVEDLEAELSGRLVDPIDFRSFPAVAPLSVVPERWRQTFLAKHAVCPRDAYLYVKYNGGPLSHPLAGGTLLHRAVERYIRHLWDENMHMGTPEIAKDILNETMVDSTDLTVSPERFDSLRGMMYHIAEGLAIDPEKIVCLETPVELEVAGRMVTGTVDFAEFDPGTATLTVFDWKSAFYNVAAMEEEQEGDSEAIPSREEWPGTFQLVLYALSLAVGNIDGSGFGLDGVQNFRLRQVHPRHFWKREGEMAHREAFIDRDTLLDWQLYLQVVVEKVEASFAEWKFPAQIGSHCDYCTSSAECPIPPAARNFRGEVRTEEDARRAAILWESLDRQKKQVWNALKGWGKRTGKRLRYAADRELRWKKTESEKVKDKVAVAGSSVKIKGVVALKEAVHKSTELGIPFDWDNFYTPSVSTRYTPRTLTDEELDKEKGTTSED